MSKIELSESAKQKLLVDLEKSHTEGRSNQREARRKWSKVEHYVAGRQYWNPGSAGRLGRPVGHEQAGASGATGNVDDEWVIFNEIRRIFLTNMQRLTSYFIDVQVVPDSKDAIDKQSARMGRLFLNDILRKAPAERLKAMIARCLILYNTSFVKVYWDPTKGRLIRKEQIKENDNALAKGIKKVRQWFLGNEMVHEGEIIIEPVNPRNVILPRYTNDLRKAPWIEEIHVENVNYIYQRFNVVVEPEQVRADDLGIQGAGAGWLDDPESEGRIRGASEAPSDQVLLKERIIMPCPEFQRGAILTWVSKHLLRSETLLDHYPGLFWFKSHIEFNDKDIYGNSILWDLLPIQDSINTALSAVARWIKSIALLRLWIPAASNVKEKDLDNSTGLAVVFDGDKAPMWDQIPAVPQSVFEILNLYRDFAQSYGFSNELAKMRKAISGNALGMLQEMDDTIFRPALESVQSMLSEAADFALMLAPKYISTPRAIKAFRMKGWEVEQAFKGEMLKGSFHAQINLMAGMPSNKVMRLEFLKSLYKDGLMAKEDVQAYMEFPNDAQALEDVQKQHEIADERVRALMDVKNYDLQEVVEPSTGRTRVIKTCKVQFHKFDNHAMIAAKLQVAMQEGYDEWDFWIQTAVLDHWQYHLAQMAASQPPAPPAGGPGAPMPPPMAPGGSPGVFPGPPAVPGGGPMGVLADSMQNPSQQPPRELIPEPMNKGFTG